MITQAQGSKAIFMLVLFGLFLVGLVLTNKTGKQNFATESPQASLIPDSSSIRSILPQQSFKPSIKPSESLNPSNSPITQIPAGEEYILQYSEGACNSSNQCVYAEYGCGGGHGICTTTPEKYKDMMTTCEYNPDFPAFLGYSCECIASISKCGWINNN